MRRAVYYTLIFLLLCSPAYSNVYYVSTAGSDSNNGAIGTPYRTIVHGLTLGHGGSPLQPDDILYIRGGTPSSPFVYNTPAVPDYVDGGIITIPSGTSGHNIIISGYPTETAVMMANANYSVLALTGTHYTTWQNLTMDDSDGALFNTGHGCDVMALGSGVDPTTSSFNLFQNLHLIGPYNNTIRGNGVISGHDNTFLQVEIEGISEHAIYLNYDNNTWDGTYIHNNGVLGGGGGVAQDLTALHLYRSGGNPSNNIFRNSIITTNYGPAAIVVGTNNLIYNNLIYGNGFGNSSSSVIFGVPSSTQSHDSFFYNNVIYGGDVNGLDISDTTFDLTIKNNIMFGNASSDYINGSSHTITVATNICGDGTCGAGSVDPLFVDASTGDFHLDSMSPAIGTGTDLSATFTTDYAGALRTAPWTIGAYISGSGPPPGGNTITSEFLTTRTYRGEVVTSRTVSGETVN